MDQTKFRTLAFGAILLVLPSIAYASCDDTTHGKLWIDTTEGETNSMGQPVIGGEAASTRAERECREEQDRQSWYQTLGIATDENTETLFKGTTDSFKSGGSFVFGILTAYRRAYNNPADPGFDPLLWLDENRERNQIETQYLSSFAGTSSEAEANALLANVNEHKAAQARVRRMGTASQFAAKAIAALPDIAVALCGLALLSIPVRAVFQRTNKEKPKRATINR